MRRQMQGGMKVCVVICLSVCVVNLTFRVQNEIVDPAADSALLEEPHHQ